MLLLFDVNASMTVFGLEGDSFVDMEKILTSGNHHMQVFLRCFFPFQDHIASERLIINCTHVPCVDLQTMFRSTKSISLGSGLAQCGMWFFLFSFVFFLLRPY